MTSYKDTYLNGEHHLIGVCFLPGAFSQFYNYPPLAEIKEQTIELEKALAPDTSNMQELSFAELNAFFLKRFNAPKHDLFTIVKCIKEARGKSLWMHWRKGITLHPDNWKELFTSISASPLKSLLILQDFNMPSPQLPIIKSKKAYWILPLNMDTTITHI